MSERVTAQFLDRWFNQTKNEFSQVLLPLAGQPLTYVEVGCWGGGSAEWTCKNILTHPDCRGFGIDPYDQSKERRRWDVEAIRALAMFRIHETDVDWEWIRKPSIEGLIDLRARKIGIDILYLDGIHESDGVLQDFVLAWPMLKVGSIVVFDDYDKDAPWPHVKDAVQAIRIGFRDLVEEISHGRQYSLRVIRKEQVSLRQRK